MEKSSLELVKKYNFCEVPFEIKEPAYLLIELDGNDYSILFDNAENPTFSST